MHPTHGLIVPYASYITLAIVGVVIVLMLSIKLAWREHRFLSESDLVIFSQPEYHSRKNQSNSRGDKDLNQHAQLPPRIKNKRVSH